MRASRQIVQGPELARHPHEILVPKSFDVARTDVGVVPLERVDHISQRELEGLHRAGTRRYDVLPLVPADHVHFGDAGHAGELWPDDPVHHRVEVGRVVLTPVRLPSAWRNLQGEHEDFAEPRRDGAQLGLEALGKSGARLLQAL